jgi:hypothetical protein
MLKFFWSNTGRRGPAPSVPRDLSWDCDPLAHPAIARMTPAELADLPLGRVRYDCGRGG